MKLQWLELIDGTKWPHLITESKNGEHMTSDRNIFEFELDLQPKFYFGNKCDEIKEEDDASTNRLRILSSDVSDLMILLQDLQRDQCVPKQIARLLEAKSLGAAVINAYEAYGILAQALLTKSCTSKSIDKLTQILTLFVIEDEETDEDEDEAGSVDFPDWENASDFFSSSNRPSQARSRVSSVNRSRTSSWGSTTSLSYH